MTGRQVSNDHTTRYQLNHRASWAFESELLQKVLEKMNELIVWLVSLSDKKQIVDKYATCKQTARLLKEFRDRNDEYQVPYILYTPELMLEHEKILDDTSIQYRKLLCSILTKN